MIENKPISNPVELRTRREILEVFWRKGVSGSALLLENTALIDSHLQQNFTDCPEAGDKMCLVALGGYGRSELFPFSDIDILLLHDHSVENDLGAVTEAIFYPLWDAGLEVGHSVRTIDACLSDAADDFFFQVALLDARYLIGAEDLLNDLRAAYQKKYVDGRRQGFLEDMVGHRTERHKRFGKHTYQLEPQIKESRGGLRDIQAMIWTAHVVFGLKDLSAIKNAGLLNEQEYEQCLAAWNHLIRIRNRLHYISGRKNDRLFFEHQAEIAKAFKYRKGKGQLEVEHFMRDVYDHMQTIAVTSDLFFEHADEVINKGVSAFKSSAVPDKAIERGLEIIKERIHLPNRDLLQGDSTLLMKVFACAAKTNIPIHYLTRKLVSESLDLIDDPFRSSRANRKMFLKIVQQSTSLPVLEIMLESGFLAAYLPEFFKLKSLAQHDIYHVYTVDHHQIQAVYELHKIRKEQRSVFQHIQAPHLLFLATLIHDIGKGLGGNHSEAGADLALNVGSRLGLKTSECDSLRFLVLNHLFLIDTAMHRDLEDPDLIKRCSKRVQNAGNLAMLYLLSIADAKATGPTVWNNWKEALLLDLYLKIGLNLDKSESSDHDLTQGIEWICEKVDAILGGQQGIRVQDLPEDYLLNFSPEEIANHIKSWKKLDKGAALVDLENSKNHCSLLMMTHDRQGLLANLCGVLALYDLKVLSAQIFTWPDGTVVDMLNVQSPYSDQHAPPDLPSFKKNLDLAINHRLGLEHRLSRKKNYGTSVKAAPYQAVKVNFDNDSSSQYTIIEVHAQDSAGLLYVITRTLSYFQINIFRAKIGSRLDQVVDVFYVLDHDKNKLTDPFLIDELRQSLEYAAKVKDVR